MNFPQFLQNLISNPAYGKAHAPIFQGIELTLVENRAPTEEEKNKIIVCAKIFFEKTFTSQDAESKNLSIKLAQRASLITKESDINFSLTCRMQEIGTILTKDNKELTFTLEDAGRCDFLSIFAKEFNLEEAIPMPHIHSQGLRAYHYYKQNDELDIRKNFGRLFSALETAHYLGDDNLADRLVLQLEEVTGSIGLLEDTIDPPPRLLAFGAIARLHEIFRIGAAGRLGKYLALASLLEYPSCRFFAEAKKLLNSAENMDIPKSSIESVRVFFQNLHHRLGNNISHIDSLDLKGCPISSDLLLELDRLFPRVRYLDIRDTIKTEAFYIPESLIHKYETIKNDSTPNTAEATSSNSFRSLVKWFRRN